jgi:hypothetical protein
VPAPAPIEFDCPKCRYRIAVARTDKEAVRKVGSGGKRVLLIRVACPGCEREIVRTVLEPDRK